MSPGANISFVKRHQSHS